jgi:hypothetical protein
MTDNANNTDKITGRQLAESAASWFDPLCLDIVALNAFDLDAQTDAFIGADLDTSDRYDREEVREALARELARCKAQIGIYDLGKTSKRNRSYAHDLASPFAQAIYDAITSHDNYFEAHTFDANVNGTPADYPSLVRLCKESTLPYGWHTLTLDAWIALHEVEEWESATVAAADGRSVETVVL